MAKKGSSDSAGEGGGFKSFKDLLRASGGEPEPEAEDSGPGWTLEDGEQVMDADDLLDGPGPETAARVLIDRRPAAFGIMEHGPPPYRDTDSEEMQLLHSFRVRTVFPEDVLGEIRGLPTDPDPEEYAGREDVRQRCIFTIDGDDAKDYDDAIEMIDLGGGRVELGVHIADVSHYVRPGTALDAEALARGTSVYLADQVVPMLPEELSNGLCSLVGERDRFAFSVYMVFDAKGHRQSYRVHKSVIRSVRRNTYREVQAALDGDPEVRQTLAALLPSLELLQRWTQQQQSLRDAKGSLRIDSTERKFQFDENHEVSAIVDAERYFSMTLIEETALAANQAVGDFFRERGLPTIYRVHPEKDPDEIEAVAKLLEKHGIRVPKKERLTGRDIGRMIRAARRRPNAEALIGRIMGLVERAVYEVKDHENVARHWGLAREAYLHFTSPIRRYPDLMVHRWLFRVLTEGAEAEAELKATGFVEELNDVAGHSSMQADIAEMTSRAVDDLKVCQYMEPHIGKKVEAKVLRVSKPGLEVLLTEFNVRGFLPARSIGDRVKVEGSTITIGRGKRVLSFSEGYAIAVQVKDVDFLRLQVMLELDR
jgi:ribonuclease R